MLEDQHYRRGIRVDYIDVIKMSPICPIMKVFFCNSRLLREQTYFVLIKMVSLAPDGDTLSHPMSWMNYIGQVCFDSNLGKLIILISYY